MWYLPVVGNSPSFRKLSKKHGGPHLAFENLAKEYKTPVLGLKLGKEYVIYVETYDLVKEVYNREEFEGR
jgi:Cytochrome P450